MDEEGKFLAAFEKAPEFFDALSPFLAVDLQHEPTLEENQEESTLLNKLVFILLEYHEQSYLLDPFLESMVTPVIEVLRAHVAHHTKTQATNYCSSRIFRLTTLLYNFIKFRGRKTIVNFFPHQVSDLPIVLQYLEDSNSPCQLASQWSLRYVLLLWLSLICMIPFDLVRFDVEPVQDNISHTARKMQLLADIYLSRAGVEREAAAILLCKLFTREDSCVLLPEFIENSQIWMKTNPDYFKTVGILHVLSEMVKSGIPSAVTPYVGGIRDILNQVESADHLLNNILVRKYRVKLEGRLTVGLLPNKKSRSLLKGKTLTTSSRESEQYENPENLADEDMDIPDDAENTISILLESLQDKDTTVRYSTAKHLSRISERLPSFLADQILDNVFHLFSAHLSLSKKIEDLPTIAEPTWHGACLACAEMVRRGLITDHYLKDLLDWLEKALIFDIRQGSHSVGSSVRDAAAYAIWALARSYTKAMLQPYVMSLAQRLVSVSLFDREVPIRRAASAAFQESVGRLGLFPHGIDIIRKADFFAVGIRNNSFLNVAPQVAEHEEYRDALIEHILNRSLIHWDPSMRLLAARSLRVICEINLMSSALMVRKRLMYLLNSVDLNEVHGGFLGLSELAAAYKMNGHFEEERFRLYKDVGQNFQPLLQKRNIDYPLSAACLFISNSMSVSIITSDQAVYWRKVVDYGLRHRNVDVQESAATALQEISKLVDCTDEIKRYVLEFSKASPIFQQSLARAFGQLAYDRYEHAVRDVLPCLLNAVNPSSGAFSSTVETRRNCFLSLSDLLCTLGSNILSLNQFKPMISIQVLQAFLTGLQDYTIDERGDVGSWIRIACIRGLSLTIQFLFGLGENQQSPGLLETYLPSELYHEAIAGILKQGVERLDNVRRQAGDFFLQLLKKKCPNVEGGGNWVMNGYPLLEDLFLTGEQMDWNDGQWLFPRAVRLLEIPTYRRSILHGLVLSAGSKTDSIQRPVAKYLAGYANLLPTTDDCSFSLAELCNIILELARSNPTNNQLVIPVYQTFDILLEGGLFKQLGEVDAGRMILQNVFAMATRNVSRLKNVQRILCSMKIVNGMLCIQSLFEKAISSIPIFLLHPFPRVRTESAEHLYMVMQANDLGFETDDVENILLETDWSCPVKELESKVADLVILLQNSLQV